MVISQAKTVETSKMDTRPSRRSTNENDGYFRTIQNVHHTLVAHAVTSDATEKALFRKALALEADWGLGRNPANLIEMGTSTTPLESKRGVKQMYTAGRDDGVQGTTPGQTPYCNLDDWDTSMTMGSPSKLYKDSYPADFKNTWPIGEGCFDTPWVWAHNEFTPQQTMRGKTALYGYLYSLGESSPPSGTGGRAGAAARAALPGTAAAAVAGQQSEAAARTEMAGPPAERPVAAARPEMVARAALPAVRLETPVRPERTHRAPPVVDVTWQARGDPTVRGQSWHSWRSRSRPRLAAGRGEHGAQPGRGRDE